MSPCANLECAPLSRDLAIDLGTANTLVYVRGRGIEISEPTAIALEQHSGEIVATGNEAAAMIGRTPEDIIAFRPLRGGAISDFETATRLFKLLLQRVGAGRMSKPRVIVSVPCAVTAVERRAVQEAVLAAGARTAYLIEEPMAAAIGAGMPVSEATGNLIIDVGGGTTEVACISLREMVSMRAARVGGFDIDAAIAQHIRREHAIGIGERTAEEIKMTFASAYPEPGEPKAEIRGRDLASGLPKIVKLSAGEIRQAIEEPVKQIIDTIAETIAGVPTGLLNDLVDKGMYLAGGGTLLRGLDARIAAETQVGVHHAEKPLECVVLGAARAMDALDELGAGAVAGVVHTR